MPGPKSTAAQKLSSAKSDNPGDSKPTPPEELERIKRAIMALRDPSIKRMETYTPEEAPAARSNQAPKIRTMSEPSPQFSSKYGGAMAAPTWRPELTEPVGFKVSRVASSGTQSADGVKPQSSLSFQASRPYPEGEEPLPPIEYDYAPQVAGQELPPPKPPPIEASPRPSYDDPKYSPLPPPRDDLGQPHGATQHVKAAIEALRKKLSGA